MTDLVGLGQRKPCHHQAENGATAEKEDATPHFSQPLGFYRKTQPLGFFSWDFFLTKHHLPQADSADGGLKWIFVRYFMLDVF